ncbi:hypothetical protein H9649_10725 [Sporosarcina sp. Sa2YVA2]|uniref:Uncharacterized protein n=1 Tax=Sporosarcina quadrami TaxID=2762234 RepID=A0ABR8UAJ4_9BACL|nr:hypothetical protein [Sporosarcina quadrami]MBD7985061.1 hypothetical protein [Sporosarcina quadrami]
MSMKYVLNKNKYVSIIFILSLVIFTLSILYFNELKNNANENEDLEKVSMYMYDLEVKSPLLVILFFLGLQPVESIDWEEEAFRKDLQSIFRDVEGGLTNIDYYNPQIVPNHVLLQLQDLQEKVRHILITIKREKPVDEQTINKIMSVSKSIYVCEINEISQEWSEIESKLKCMNDAIID